MGECSFSCRLLAFTSAGRAGQPRVVLLHGWPLDSSVWHDIIRPLIDGGVHVLCPDLPGLGSSRSLEPDRWTVEAYADEMAAFLRHFGDERVAVAGHSFGGYVALALAERHPDLVAGLGLVSSRTLADSEASRKGRQETIAKVRSEGTRALLPDLARKLLSPSAPRALLDRATRIIEPARPDGVVAGLAATAARPDRTVLLGAYPASVLVLHGSEDQLIPGQEAADPKGPRTVVREILRGVGHMPMWEDPPATAQAILRWARASLEADVLLRTRRHSARKN